jgi:hypothetical protein
MAVLNSHEHPIRDHILTKGTGKYLPSVVASNTIVVLEDRSIRGRLFSLVVISKRSNRSSLVSLCKFPSKIGHLAPFMAARTTMYLCTQRLVVELRGRKAIVCKPTIGSHKT